MKPSSWDRFGFAREVEALRAERLIRELREFDPERWVNFSSNDYLGLSQHEDVRAAAIRAIQERGAGGTASRLLAGTHRGHLLLEESLARFFSKESGLVFSSGYHANVGVLSGLLGAGDAVFFDRLSHASIIDGIKLSGARFFSYDHNNPEDLKKFLSRRRASYRRALIITEGVFSMDGDVPPLKEVVNLAREWEALTMIDEAHALGVWGPQGKGIAAELGVLSDVDIVVGTLSKALGSHGGFVVTSKLLVDLFVSKSRPFIYTTALSPASVAAAQAALELLPTMDGRRQAILLAAGNFRETLTALGYQILRGDSQIIPVLTGEVRSTKLLSDHLLKRGFFVPSIRPPTVPKGACRVRLSLTYEAVREGTGALATAFATYLRTSKEKDRPIVQTG